jgi:perosamine synthetase
MGDAGAAAKDDQRLRFMSDTLAIDGGTPVRAELLPYGKQVIGEADCEAVLKTLKSAWLTTGPLVGEFEKAFATMTGAKEAVAVSNGTAALHAMIVAAGIGAGDEVIVPAMTFAATSNVVLFEGGTPVFCDVDPKTLLIDVKDAEKKITKKTKAIVAVDYAGQPCDYDALKKLCTAKKIQLLADACHAVGASYKGAMIGSVADMSSFSFHPVKPMTTGEGGMITTNDAEKAKHMRRFRNHGITTDHRERQEKGSWFYEMTELGLNYRLTDIQCALGLTQLKNVPEWTKKRQKLAKIYDDAFSKMKTLEILGKTPDSTHAYHLYVIQLNLDRLNADRQKIYQALRAEGIGVNVHYVPVHMHPYYQKNVGTKTGMCPNAEKAYERILSLPMFTSMTEKDAHDVIAAVTKVLDHYQK